MIYTIYKQERFAREILTTWKILCIGSEIRCIYAKGDTATASAATKRNNNKIESKKKMIIKEETNLKIQIHNISHFLFV